MLCKTRFLAAGFVILGLVTFTPIIPLGADDGQPAVLQKGDIAAGVTECDCGTWGDVDSDAQVTPTDVAYMVNRVYRNQDALVQPPACPNTAGDANCDGTVTPLDLVLYVNFVYRSNGLGWCGDPCGPSGSLVETGACKSFVMGKTTDYTSPDSDCVAYEYDGLKVLTLRHINAGFNCCPDPIYAEILIEPGLITIDEFEGMEAGGCGCLCLFDLDYEFNNLAPGEYTIRINGLYLYGDDEPIEFTVDLASNPTGKYCVYRDHYPWGY